MNLPGGRWLCVFFAPLAAQAGPTAQNPPDVPPPAAFQTGVQLVQVGVMAEANGKPVTDLKREEFQLFDNRSPQEIRLFLNETKAPRPAPVVLPPNTFTNRAPARAGAHSGYSVIVLDTLLTDLADEGQGGSGTIWAIQKALGALHSLPPGENVAIYATGYQVWTIREFTSDRESLEQKLRTWKPSQDVIPAVDKPAVLRREIQDITGHVASIPGRKNLIWIAYQFPVSPPVMQKLRAADVAVYPIDAHGSVIGLKSDKERAGMPLIALARATGGVAYFDRDDLDVVVREAIDDGHSNYTLGFYPSDAAGPPVHQVAVSVTRPGVTLRYRNTFQIEPPPKPTASKLDLVQTMNQPNDASAIPIRASAKRVLDRLSLEAVVDLASLGLAPVQSRWSGKMEVLGRFMSADGKIVGDRPALAQTVDLKLKQPTYEAAIESGLPYRNELKIPAKAVEFKLLVANMATGKIGTVTIPLEDLTPPTSSAPAR